MNTSKSLDSILDTADWTKATPSGYLDGKALERKAKAKQAIVEAVEGEKLQALRDELEKALFRHSPVEAYDYITDRIAEIDKAIKEWQK